MKLSTRTLYGLQAVLVLAGRYGEGSMAVSQIAKRQKISVAYLEQILNSLQKKGLVRSVRGPQGGYVLDRKPSEINLESLFYALEGELALSPSTKNALEAQADEISIGYLLFWKKLKEAISRGLVSATLKDLVDEGRRIKKSKTPVSISTFHI